MPYYQPYQPYQWRHPARPGVLDGRFRQVNYNPSDYRTAFADFDRHIKPIADEFQLEDVLSTPDKALKHSGERGKSFDYSHTDFEEAKKEAARTGKKLIIGYYGSKVAGSQQYLDKTLPALKKQFGNEAIFVGVNLDEVDRNSELGKRADKSIGTSGQTIRGTGIVYTEMGSVTPGQGGKPGAFADTCILAGIGRNLMSTLAEQTSFSNRAIADTKGKFKLGPHEPREYERLTDRTQKQGEAKPEDVIAANKKVQDALAKAHGAKDFAEAEKHYLDAIKASDSISIGQLNQLRERLRAAQLEEEKKETGKQDAARIKALKDQQQAVDDLLLAKSDARLEFGLACGKAGERETGKKWILEAGRRNPRLFADPSSANPGAYGLAQSMSASSFSDQDVGDVLAKAKLPEYAAITDDKIEAPRRPERRDAPEPAMRMIKTKADWEKALADAEKEKKPLFVIGGGREWCKFCGQMEDDGAYRDAIQKYGKDAIVIHIDPGSKDATEAAIGRELGDLFGMSTYPTTAVAAVRRNRGKLEVEGTQLYSSWQKADPKRNEKYQKFLKEQIEAAKKRMTPRERERSDPRDWRLVHLDFAEEDIYSGLV